MPRSKQIRDTAAKIEERIRRECLHFDTQRTSIIMKSHENKTKKIAEQEKLIAAYKTREESMIRCIEKQEELIADQKSVIAYRNDEIAANDEIISKLQNENNQLGEESAEYECFRDFAIQLNFNYEEKIRSLKKKLDEKQEVIDALFDEIRRTNPKVKKLCNDSWSDSE